MHRTRSSLVTVLIVGFAAACGGGAPATVAPGIQGTPPQAPAGTPVATVPATAAPTATTSATSAATPALGGQFVPGQGLSCSIVTIDEINAALGATYGSPKMEHSTKWETCTWQTPDTLTFYSLTLQIYDPEVWELAANYNDSATPVNGIGDGAWSKKITGDLNVKSGDLMIFQGVVNATGATAEQKAGFQQLALLVISRL